jgi:hypothetical protein
MYILTETLDTEDDRTKSTNAFFTSVEEGPTMSGAEGIGGAAASYFAAAAQSMASIRAISSSSGGQGASSLSGGEGASSLSGGEGGGTSVSVSGTGQSFSAIA